MYIFFIMLALVSPLFCSEQQCRERFIELAKKEVDELHKKIHTIPLNSFAPDDALYSAVFFAHLPRDVRTYTLSNNFFYGDDSAAQEFESKPYAHALYLLAEYQQKPHPGRHLAPRWIFLLHPKQVAVVYEIEQQHLNMPTAPAAPAAPLARWFFLNPKPGYAKLSYQQMEILKTVPSGAFQTTPLNGKKIVYFDPPKKLWSIIKDTGKSLLIDRFSHELFSICTLFVKWVWNYHRYTSYGHAHHVVQHNIHLISAYVDGAFLLLIDRNKIPKPYNNMVQSWVCMRTGFDLLGLGVAAACNKSTLLSCASSTIFPHLPIGIALPLFVTSFARSRINGTHEYVVKRKQNNWCTLL